MTGLRGDAAELLLSTLRRRAGILAVGFAFAAAAACGNGGPDVSAPPADSYTAATFQVRIAGDPAPLPGARVSPAFFESTPTRPLLGRTFAAGEFGAEAEPVAILSHDTWQDRFEGAPDVIGRFIEVDGRLTKIVAVMPPGFEVPPGAGVWLPAPESGPAGTPD